VRWEGDETPFLSDDYTGASIGGWVIFRQRLEARLEALRVSVAVGGVVRRFQ